MHIYDYAALTFGISEVSLLVSRRSKNTSSKSRKDGNSLFWLWVIISVCLVAGFTFAKMQIWVIGDPLVLNIAGLSVIAIGFIIRWIAIIQLGNMFTVDVAISSAHILKTSGLYTIVRHPSYLGLMLIIAGLSILMNSALSMAIVIIPIFAIMNYRMSVEETALTGEFGDQYMLYKQQVKKIVPFLY